MKRLKKGVFMRKAFFNRLERTLTLAVIIMIMCIIGCGNDGGNPGNSENPGLIGLWSGVSDDGMALTIRFNSDNTFEITLDGSPYFKGVFTTAGNKLTMRYTHIHAGAGNGNLIYMGFTSGWISESEYKAALMNMGITEDTYEQTVGTIFKPNTVTYSVNGNTLSFNGAELTRQYDGESGNSGTSGGSGTPVNNGSIRLGYDDAVPANAIKINSFDDLCKIGKEAAYPLNGTYELARNIDASASRNMNGGLGFEPIGISSSSFRGGFYGKGYTISGLYINRPDDNYVALFGYISGATISGVHLVNVSVMGKDYVGGLAGMNVGNIYKCSVSGGTVTSSPATSSSAAGGLTGWNLTANSTITDSYSTAAVSGGYAGGLVGWNATGSVISRSYSSGAVNGIGNAGGLVGLLFGTIIDCYSASTVSGVSHIGGLVGSDNTVSANPTIKNSYFAGQTSGSGLLGYASTGSSHTGILTITSSYWDIESSGASISAGTGAAGKTTAQMKQRSTYMGWDFASTWNIDNGYPYLRLLGPAVSVPLSKRAAVVFNGNTFNAHASPMSAEEMELKARAEYEKMCAEVALHNTIER
jgi:hypothetical protein